MKTEYIYDKETQLISLKILPETDFDEEFLKDVGKDIGEKTPLKIARDNGKTALKITPNKIK